MSKVFGVGLSRTGTSSLAVALRQLGLRTAHYPHDTATYRQLKQGDYQLAILEKLDAIVDITVAPFYGQLDKQYPKSKFILSVRDEIDWLASMHSHFEQVKRMADQDEVFGRFTDFICNVLYGTCDYDHERLRCARTIHHEGVLHYFKERPQDLLILDICGGQGWDKLAPFLGLPVPELPFPRTNRRASVVDWTDRLSGCLESIASMVPGGTEIILVDDGKLGFAFSKIYTLRPFLQRNGVYWGKPESDETAINELEQMRESGAIHIVFAWTAFWWLDHYPVFAHHLNHNYQLMARDQDVIVYDLTSKVQ